MIRTSAQLGLVVFAACAITACSGSASKSTPCNYLYDGSASTISGVLVAPSNGATSVPTAPQTLVFNGFSDYDIVLEATTGAKTAPVQTTPTALPSPYATNPPQTGTSGYYAVSLPPLNPETTYTVGTLSDDNACAGDYTLRQFGTFTTH